MDGSVTRLPLDDDAEPLQGDEPWLSTLEDPRDTTTS